MIPSALRLNHLLGVYPGGTADGTFLPFNPPFANPDL